MYGSSFEIKTLQHLRARISYSLRTDKSVCRQDFSHTNRPTPSNQKAKMSTEDDEMLAAAALWAGGGGDASDSDGGIEPSALPSSADAEAAAPKPATPPAPAQSRSSNKKQKKAKKKEKAAAPSKANNGTEEDEWLTPDSVTYSVHITQLPYEATVREVRSLFEESGCTITSTRFVYGRDTRKGHSEQSFRGVAFCDFSDKTSFDNALKLNKSLFPGHGRRMNVRPTKTREELADIVEKREKMLDEKKFTADRSIKARGDKNKRRHIDSRRNNPGSEKKKIKWAHKKGGDGRRKFSGGKGKS